MYLQKRPIFPFDPWAIVAQKIMQVGVDVTYIHTNFGGCDLSGFGDTTTCIFKNGQFSLSTHGL